VRARRRALVVALALGAFAGAIGATLAVLPLSTLPTVNRIADLGIHVAALDGAAALGFGSQPYDRDPNPNIALITIDDATFAKLGFPFSRTLYAQLLDKLAAAGAKSVAFDIDFLEPSKEPAQDRAFAAALARVPSVLAFPVNTTTAGNIGEQRPLPSLARTAHSVGFSTVDSPGGYVIGQPMQISTSGLGSHSGERLLSLSAASYEAFTGKHLPAVSKDDDGRMLLLPPKTAHHQDLASGADVQTQAFAGRGTMSFVDAIAADPRDLRTFANGALIFVGATAAGMFDFWTTAGRGRVPGLFVNARLADQLLRGYQLRPAPLWLNALLAALLPLLAALAFTLLRTPYAIAATLAATVAYAYINLWLFDVALYWLDLAHVALAILLGTALVAIYRTMHEASQRRLVAGLFGLHVSPAVVSDILNRDDPRTALALEGKRVRATIFYSDIRGFTAISETMTPEAVYSQLNEYFDAMCAIIFAHGGYVDKFIGDCVMAVFSAPYQTPDDARNAVVAAVEQQDKIRELRRQWKAEGKNAFEVGMGINTGEVVMGNLGATSRMNYTVVGDEVNVAARLYNVARGGEIIISETTYAQCREIVEVDPLEPVEVKGKTKPIAVYRVRSLKGACTPPSGSSS
jgi:adenylate cyclase